MTHDLKLFCDRCRSHQSTASSHSVAGVSFVLCAQCKEDFYRPVTPDHPRDPRDVDLEWLF